MDKFGGEAAQKKRGELLKVAILPLERKQADVKVVPLFPEISRCHQAQNSRAPRKAEESFRLYCNDAIRSLPNDLHKVPDVDWTPHCFRIFNNCVTMANLIAKVQVLPVESTVALGQLPTSPLGGKSVFCFSRRPSIKSVHDLVSLKSFSYTLSIFAF